MTMAKLNKNKPPTVATPMANAIALPGGAGTISQVPGQPPRMKVGEHGLRLLGGSTLHQFNDILLNATLATMWVPQAERQDQTGRIAAAGAALAAFKPMDEIEGMLAAQAVALHYATMECLRQATLPNQPPDIASKLRRDGANMARGMTDMLDALDRKRGKAPQVVRVERVVVHEGGQGIVRNVQAMRARG